jgi:hypothetical protein
MNSNALSRRKRSNGIESILHKDEAWRNVSMEGNLTDALRMETQGYLLSTSPAGVEWKLR